MPVASPACTPLSQLNELVGRQLAAGGCSCFVAGVALRLLLHPAGGAWRMLVQVLAGALMGMACGLSYVALQPVRRGGRRRLKH
ncbi:hypothetical protein DYQ86_25300 [Acidobacteria bacterium AB60]|nr:hypothetical protein DYQ86_25300 [Acidobacteria bacterium AB60]